jgi:hypothetical protein
MQKRERRKAFDSFMILYALGASSWSETKGVRRSRVFTGGAAEHVVVSGQLVV